LSLQLTDPEELRDAHAVMDALNPLLEDYLERPNGLAQLTKALRLERQELFAFARDPARMSLGARLFLARR